LRWVVVFLTLAASVITAWWYFAHPREPKPFRIQLPDRIAQPAPDPPPLPNAPCGANVHLAGTVSSRVDPKSYAIVGYRDGDPMQVTNVRTSTAALPEAGDRLEIWGVVECEGPRYHIVETRRESRSR
jgi:hypothetical protein